MSTLAVKVERVRAIQAHPNADRLEIATVLGWQCVVQKGSFKPNDLCVYFPIDAILPQSVEEAIFGPDSKVKLHKSRVRTIKLRGAISQGLAVKLDTLSSILKGGWLNRSEGCDLTRALGVTKYEPPPPRQAGMRNLQKSWRKRNLAFKEYTDIENAKNYPDVLVEGERVSVTEKIHGTNFRAGWVPYDPSNWFMRLMAKLRLTPKYEFVFGSRKVQLQDPGRLAGTGFYETQSNGDGPPPGNVYSEAVVKYDLKRRIPKGTVLYGEIYGDGIQKGYTYGCKRGERKVAFFDMMRDGRYEGPRMFQKFCEEAGLPTVPFVSDGVEYTASLKDKLACGPSILDPTQKVREGVVIRPIHERRDVALGRVILKCINDAYLLGAQTEYH